jgi:hypothetical protein
VLHHAHRWDRWTVWRGALRCAVFADDAQTRAITFYRISAASRTAPAPILRYAHALLPPSFASHAPRCALFAAHAARIIGVASLYRAGALRGKCFASRIAAREISMKRKAAAKRIRWREEIGIERRSVVARRIERKAAASACMPSGIDL